MIQKNSFENEEKISQWKNKLINSGCRINGIKPLTLLRKKDGSLLFALVESDVESADGTKLLPYCFIRGHACIVVPLIENQTGSYKKLLMVSQKRIAHGGDSLEFPAGMLDNEYSAPESIAVKEVKEETGLSITADDLIPLADRPFYTSSGACDEMVYIYGCKKILPDNEINSLEGRITGMGSENEHITLHLKTIKEAQNKIVSTQARLALFLFINEFVRSTS